MHLDLCLTTSEEEGKTLSPDRLAEAIVDLKEDLGEFLEGFEVKNAEHDDDAEDVRLAVMNIEGIRADDREDPPPTHEFECTDYEKVLYDRFHEFLNMGLSITTAIASLHRVEGTEIFRVRDEFWDFIG